MKTSSADGKRDLLLGLVVLVVFSFLGYLLLTNITFILNNFLIILFIFLGGMVGIVVLFFLADLVTAGLDYLKIMRDSDEYDIKDPDIPDIPEDNQLPVMEE